MVKKLLGFLLLLVVVGVRGQSFSFMPADTIRLDSTVVNGSKEIDLIGGLYNSTNAPLTLSWRRVNFVVPKEWVQQVCDNYQCYGATALSSNHTTQPIPVATTGLLKLGLNMNCTSGNGLVQLRVWVTGDSANTAKDITYIANFTAAANCVTTGIADVNTDIPFTFYPNPVGTAIHLGNLDGFDNIRGVVFNILGNRVLDADVSASKTINLQNLSQGVYLLKLYDGNRLLGVRKFQKAE
ncbi:MAG: T9SS type A sorting domain-containing protein [Chitinophagales bacterium]